jgi:hypothetical protein
MLVSGLAHLKGWGISSELPPLAPAAGTSGRLEQASATLKQRASADARNRAASRRGPRPRRRVRGSRPRGPRLRRRRARRDPR